MPGIIDPTHYPPPPPSPDPDDGLFSDLFDLGVTEGAVQIAWQQATPCQCLTPDTKQPDYSCAQCGGTGVRYEPARQITGLFRGQSRWLSFRRQGEIDHGEAQLTTPLSVKPGYVSRLIRDRLTIPAAPNDESEGRVFYPAASPVPFIFNSIQRAWRVQLQSAELSQQLAP